MGGRLYALFADLKAAFDNADRVKVSGHLKWSGVELN